MTDVEEKSCCRACKASCIVPILDLGEQYASTFLAPGEAPHYMSPLQIVMCDPREGGCGLIQLKHTVNQSLLYNHYWYRSGVNESMRVALEDVVSDSVRRANGLCPGDVVVDIGCNDGTLLQAYPDSVLRVGFDPAENALRDARAAIADGVFVHDYFSCSGYPCDQRAKIVTSIAMFYDLDDPHSFVADLGTILAEDGLWVIQMSYLPSMLAQNAFDNICHEHLAYYTLSSIAPILACHGLAITDVTLNDVNGGSFRLYVQHQSFSNGRVSRRVGQLLRAEREMELTTLRPYQEFARRVEEQKERLIQFVQRVVREGKQVWVYGASTKGNTLLQYYGLDCAWITAAADRNPEKWGLRTVATDIPIVSEEEARKVQPDYLLALPWHFIDTFVWREHHYLRQGGAFLVPLPEFRVVRCATAGPGLHR